MSNRRAVTVDTVWTGVDWISATLGREELDDQVWLFDAIHALEQVALAGNKYTRRHLLGFDGWESGGCFVGSNEKRHYAQFVGKYANDAYTYVDHPKVHISRIDLQVTVQYSEELLKEGKAIYAKSVRFNQGLPEHKRRKINIFIGSDGGDTVYLGAPSSDTRARIYNKQRQSQMAQYDRSWRYEVVYKNDYALPVFRRIISEADEASGFILSEVSAYLRNRGVQIRGLGIGGDNPLSPPKSPPSDVERKLRWIRNQVVPTIRTLAELGYAEELMDAISEAISSARNQT
jgi:hypothetical protein